MKMISPWDVKFLVAPEEVVYSFFNFPSDTFYNSIYLTYAPQF